MNQTNLIEDLRLLAPPNHTWMVVAVLSVLIVVALVVFWRRHRRAAPAGTSRITVGAEDIWAAALAELERLAPLLRPEASREYGIASTGVLRRFVEQRYGLHAPRLATEEFLWVAQEAGGLPAEARQQLGEFLALGDLFKFGRYSATSEELRAIHTAAVRFVMVTRPTAASPDGESPPDRSLSR